MMVLLECRLVTTRIGITAYFDIGYFNKFHILADVLKELQEFYRIISFGYSFRCRVRSNRE